HYTNAWNEARVSEAVTSFGGPSTGANTPDCRPFPLGKRWFTTRVCRRGHYPVGGRRVGRQPWDFCRPAPCRINPLQEMSETAHLETKTAQHRQTGGIGRPFIGPLVRKADESRTGAPQLSSRTASERQRPKEGREEAADQAGERPAGTYTPF